MTLDSVSRETGEKFAAFQALIEKWSPKINLVAPSTLKDIQHRHIQDSTQLFYLAPSKFEHWVDLGSGGGLPGVVIAILSVTLDPVPTITLVESDARKCAFLSETRRSLGLAYDIMNERAEDTPPLHADVVSARALAPLAALLPLANRHMKEGGTALFPKGKNAREELAATRKDWQFDVDIVKSSTDHAASILKIERLKHV